MLTYGQVQTIREEMWTQAYRYKLYNGVKIVEMKLKQHIPSHLAIAGNNTTITYDGQPTTCYRCNEIGHLQSECPRKYRQVQPLNTRQQWTWADRLANTLRADKTEQETDTMQTESETTGKNTEDERENMEESNQNGQQKRLPTNCAHETKNNCQMETEKVDPITHDKGMGKEGASIEQPRTGKTADKDNEHEPHSEGRPDSDLLSGNSSLAGEEIIQKMEIQGNPIVRAEQTGQPIADSVQGRSETIATGKNMILLTGNPSRPKILKTEREEAMTKVRNRSKSRLKSAQ